MANIKVDLPIPIYDGMPVTFKAPADCSEITGLRVYYPNGEGVTTSQDFTLSDANRNNVGNINNLFTANAIVKVILDTDEHMAFIQNADTNAYLEGRFDEYLPLTGGTVIGTGMEILNIERTVSGTVSRVGVGINGYKLNGSYPAIITLNRDGTQVAYLQFNETGIVFKDGVTKKTYNLFGEHNKDLFAESFLSSAGGTLTGDVTINKVSAPRINLKSGSGDVSIYKNADATKNYGVTIADNNTAGAVAQLNMNAANAANTALRLTLTPAGGTAKACAIFGEHNKPTGTYTGYGSTKTISVGGVGNMLLLYGNEMLALVTPMGAICKMYDSDAIYGIKSSYLGFSGGKLTISGTANTNFNASGVTYNYQVL